MTLAIQKKAVERALSKVGKRNQVGMCAYENRTLWELPSVGDWDGDGSPDAEDQWKKAVRVGKVVKTNDPNDVPAGALVYMSGGRNDNWHVATSYARAKVVSTDWGGVGIWGKGKISDICRKWGLTLVGYVTIAWDGTPIYAPPRPVAPVVKGTYEFKKRTMRRGSPGLGHEHHKHNRKGAETWWKKGQRFRVTAERKVDGILWGKNPYGNWAPMRSLKKR